jgi:DNA-binding response OmpR family regulator
VPGSSANTRVLVVDDVEEMRILIHRALGGRGYDVDVAATLAEARTMGPAGYDAVLVDAHLGSERGIELVEALCSEDPAAAGRCLVMTGGATDRLPEGVACLAKPFQLGELIAAVSALGRPRAVPPADRQAGPGPGPCPSPGLGIKAGMRPGRSQPPAAGPQAWQLLRLTRQLRERERHELVDFLHDGPIQELTAVTLELQMMARSVPSAPRFERVLQRLSAASGSLRWLVDGPLPFHEPETRLATSLQQRTAWMLATPVTVDADEQGSGLAASEISVVADIVELMLLGMATAGPPVQAHVAVRTDEDLIQIGLTRTSAPADDQAPDGLATAQPTLDALASALGATVDVDISGRHWLARIVLRRQAASAPVLLLTGCLIGLLAGGACLTEVSVADHQLAGDRTPSPAFASSAEPQRRRYLSLGQAPLCSLLPDPVPHDVKVALLRGQCQASFTELPHVLDQPLFNAPCSPAPCSLAPCSPAPCSLAPCSLAPWRSMASEALMRAASSPMMMSATTPLATSAVG